MSMCAGRGRAQGTLKRVRRHGRRLEVINGGVRRRTSEQGAEQVKGVSELTFGQARVVGGDKHGYKGDDREIEGKIRRSERGVGVAVMAGTMR
ncbi:hypothetical protein GUJ93_ZPchr0012g21959 [Zizania palustris]|uniref:Uncharacterized protein n=1 Tax=Zizania palustris TaxID=103762 RepID=A0A8J6BPY3_ZIZPA|nr:hypothetical protein GUJ93_ZPchr0012g21959 [Zizania palustris]